jgi:hypothetical protein
VQGTSQRRQPISSPISSHSGVVLLYGLPHPQRHPDAGRDPRKPQRFRSCRTSFRRCTRSCGVQQAGAGVDPVPQHGMTVWGIEAHPYILSATAKRPHERGAGRNFERVRERRRAATCVKCWTAFRRPRGGVFWNRLASLPRVRCRGLVQVEGRAGLAPRRSREAMRCRTQPRDERASPPGSNGLTSGLASGRRTFPTYLTDRSRPVHGKGCEQDSGGGEGGDYKLRAPLADILEVGRIRPSVIFLENVN